MANQQEVQVRGKQELEKKQEGTKPGRVFIAVTDIFETDQALTVLLEMPGVNKDSVDVRVENDVLSVEGHVDFSNYAGLQPVYTEYNVGNYARSFHLSSKIEQDAIKAELKDGVMTLVLPKAEKARARKINVT
jgi:HSP20 family molecular chaperone IbpA